MKRTARPEPAVVKVCETRGGGDCSLVSFATLTGIAYEDVLVQAAKVDPAGGRNGLYWTQLKAIGRAFGITLRLRRAPDLEEDTGILGVSFPPKKEHACVLKRGQVIDVDGTVWDADVYLGQPGYKARTLLYIAER